MSLLTLKILENTLIPVTKSQWEPCPGNWCFCLCLACVMSANIWSYLSRKIMSLLIVRRSIGRQLAVGMNLHDLLSAAILWQEKSPKIVPQWSDCLAIDL